MLNRGPQVGDWRRIEGEKKEEKEAKLSYWF
jgi:hypothetical protein